jgi:membrane protease YdiL (CAAX protease family)
MSAKLMEGRIAAASDRRYPWRQFAILVVAGTVAALLVISYQLALLPLGPNAPPLAQIVVTGIVNGAIQIAVAVGVGLLVARSVGLRAPVTEAIASGGDVHRALREIDPVRAILLGAGASVAVIILAVTVFAGATASIASAAAQPGRFLGLLASFEGGITEEILLRLFVMSVLAWLLARIWRDRPPAVFWTANIVAAVLFGLGHLPATAALVALTPLVIARAVVLNGVVGVVAGWLYWRRGLESAMVAHFSADIVLHVLAGG